LHRAGIAERASQQAQAVRAQPRAAGTTRAPLAST
jgi:hypothetical protein